MERQAEGNINMKVDWSYRQLQSHDQPTLIDTVPGSPVNMNLYLFHLLCLLDSVEFFAFIAIFCLFIAIFSVSGKKKLVEEKDLKDVVSSIKSYFQHL